MLAYAHQGGAKEGPSSTLAAIDAALAAGADAIELDVHATRDGALVVCHDATLERTSNGVGPIAQHELAALQGLDNAFFFVPGEDAQPGRAPDAYPLRGRAPADRRYSFASLEEVLRDFPGVFLNLDIKQSAPAVPAYEAALAQILHAYGRSDDVIVASFNDTSTRAFRSEAPDIGTSAGAADLAMFARAVFSGSEPDPLLSRHVALQVPPSLGGVRLVDERFVATAHDVGLAVHVWTIDDEDEMAGLVALGVDGIMTDRPSRLAAVLERLGATYRPGRS